MISRNIAQQVLFSPIDIGADKLCIISGYSSPNMVSWLLRTLYERKSKPINIQRKSKLGNSIYIIYSPCCDIFIA